MAKIFIKQGNAAVGVSDELDRMVNNLLDSLPKFRKLFEDSVEEIYQDAYRQWPVRTERPRTGEEKKRMTRKALERRYGKEGAFAIMRKLEETQSQRFEDDTSVIVSKKSEDSKNKLERGILIDGEDLVAFVRNTAPYAWAIKTGAHTLNDLPLGSRTCNELLWAPMKRTGDKLVRLVARDMIKESKKR